MRKGRKAATKNATKLRPGVWSALATYLDGASEDQLTQNIIVPLFQRMGFSNVKAKGHIDKQQEYGQDIRGEMKLRLPTGHSLYFTAVIKRGKISSSASEPSKNVENVLTEASMAFGKEVYDPETNQSITVDHVFIVSCGRITEGARQYLLHKLSISKKRRCLFIDRNDLLELLKGYGLPRDRQEIICPSLPRLRPIRDEEDI